jgi:hypothetical protein
MIGQLKTSGIKKGKASGVMRAEIFRLDFTAKTKDIG